MNYFKKKVCIFINTLRRGGAEKQALLLAKMLKRDYSVTLLVYYGNKLDPKSMDYIATNELDMVSLRGSHIKKIVKFNKYLKENEVEVLFTYLLTTNLIGSIVGKIAGTNQIYTGIRNSFIDKRKIGLQRFIQNYLCTKTIYNNYRGVDNLSKIGFKSKKAIVIPNCYEFMNGKIVREKKEKVTILSLGRFIAQKDWFTALESVKALHQIYTNINYFIVGYGDLEQQLREWIDKNKTNEYMKLVVSPQNVNEYYEKSDIYLQTSLYEGLSNTVLEAMSFSLPLVVTDAGDNDKLVHTDANGYLCEVGNINQISANLGKLILSYKKRVEFGEKSFEIVAFNYSSNTFRTNYCKLIETN